MGKLGAALFGGKRNPQQTVINAVDIAQDAEIAVVVIKTKDGYIDTGWSDGCLTSRLGMLDLAKRQMIQTSEEEEG